MAGDWIKMRVNLVTDPAVKAMARGLKLDAFSVVGRLHSLWSWADEHTEDGALPFTTREDIDDLTGKRGFADNLVAVGWLTDEDGKLSLPNFDRHNSDSAKRRAMETEKKRRQRNGGTTSPQRPELVPMPSGQNQDNTGTREEKRREDIEEEEEEGAPGEFGLDMLEASAAEPVWTKDAGWAGIHDEHKARWKIAFPACDIARQLAQMDVWLRANPAEAHKSKWARFITGWLKREQDRGGDVRSDRRQTNNANNRTGNSRSFSQSQSYAGLTDKG